MKILALPALRALPLLCLTGALTACAGWTQAHRDNAMAEFKKTTMAKAAFSLDCAEAQIEVKLVPEDKPFPTTALVSGCGKKATYVKVNGDWLMESGPGK
ncbi:MAG: hypothetical protein U0359_34410 [Byssovorax sp.]